MPPRLSDPCFCLDVWCSLLQCTGNRKFSNADLYLNWKWKFMQLFDCFETIVTKMTRNHWFGNCEKNYKGNIRHIQIKCTIIIIVQYIFTYNLPFIVQFHESCNKRYWSLTCTMILLYVVVKYVRCYWGYFGCNSDILD